MMHNTRKVISVLVLFIMVTKLFCANHSKLNLKTTEYTKTCDCNTDDKIANGCVAVKNIGVTGSMSVMCGKLCSDLNSCEGFSLGREKGLCLIHSHCETVNNDRTNQVCNSSNDKSCMYFERKPTSDSCLNGGVWDHYLLACICINSFVGSRCERYPTECNELKEYGYSGSVFTGLKPQGFSYPFYVHCRLDTSKGKTVVARRADEASNFNRTFLEYNDGFIGRRGSNKDIWTGLKHFEYLVQVQNLHTLIISLIIKNELGASSFRFKYNDFTMEKYNNSLYKYSYSSSSYNAYGPLNSTIKLKSCLTQRAQVSFSAPDVDNDADQNTNCAREAASGWWFVTCNPSPTCNPFGTPYVTGLEPETPDRIHLDGVDARSFHDARFSVTLQLQ